MMVAPSEDSSTVTLWRFNRKIRTLMSEAEIDTGASSDAIDGICNRQKRKIRLMLTSYTLALPIPPSSVWSLRRLLQVILLGGLVDRRHRPRSLAPRCAPSTISASHISVTRSPVTRQSVRGVSPTINLSLISIISNAILVSIVVYIAHSIHYSPLL